MVKYSDLSDQYIFYQVAAETHVLFNKTAHELWGDFCGCIARVSGDDLESCSSCQHLFVMVQCFNLVLLHDIFVNDYHLD